MNFKIIMPNEGSQIKRKKYCKNILNLRKYKFIYRDRKQFSGFLRTGAKRKMDYKETQGNWVEFTILILVMVTLVYTYVKNHQIAYFT